jgi:hypothetical protein
LLLLLLLFYLCTHMQMQQEDQWFPAKASQSLIHVKEKAKYRLLEVRTDKRA